MENTIFVCGALRSGSSLTHLILDSHPNIKNPGEFDFLFDQITDSGDFLEIDAYHAWLANHRIFNSKGLSIDKSLNYSELIESFVSQLSDAENILALNIHRGFDRIPFLFENAKFLHLLRDPRDVARSTIGMGWAGNVYYGVDHWITTEKSWDRLKKKISQEQYIEIKFEELIQNTEQVLEKICIFAGVKYSQAMLNYAHDSSYSKPDPALVNQWKQQLSVREIQQIEFRAHELMQLRGYELSGHEISAVTVFEKIYLKIQNKFSKIHFSIKRYGFALYLSDLLSRRLQLKNLQAYARLKINEIDKAYLK